MGTSPDKISGDYRFSSDLSDDMRSATFGTEIWMRNQTDRKVKDLTVEINLVGKDNKRK